MKKTHKHTLTLSALLLFTSSISAYNLSESRGFHLNGGLNSVARQIGVNPKEADVLHVRPTLIQELTWRSEPTDSVDQVVFGFYDSELFRMVVSYQRDRTDGLTTADLIEAISEEYGPAATPSAELSLSTVYDDNESIKILALWEDAQWSFNSGAIEVPIGILPGCPLERAERSGEGGHDRSPTLGPRRGAAAGDRSAKRGA